MNSLAREKGGKYCIFFILPIFRNKGKKILQSFLFFFVQTQKGIQRIQHKKRTKIMGHGATNDVQDDLVQDDLPDLSATAKPASLAQAD